MSRVAILFVFLFGLAGPAAAHQIWIEQSDEEAAVIRFGEFGENLRETSPGLLDKFGRLDATLLSASGERKAEPVKAATGFVLPFKAGAGDTILAEDASYPLNRFKQGEREVTNWYRPAARLATSLAPQEPKLTLDIVPAAEAGTFTVVFKGRPLPKAKLGMTIPAGWTKEERTDEQGRVSFSFPWKGSYVLEVGHIDRTPGERTEAGKSEKYDGVNYVTTLHVSLPDGLPPLPPGPPAAPNK